MNCNNDNSDVRNSQEIIVDTPYGKLHIATVDGAQDHVSMKACELQALFVLISGEGQEGFSHLADDLQNSLLWMAQQAASQIGDVVSQVNFFRRGVSK